MNCRKECAILFFPLFLWLCLERSVAQPSFIPDASSSTVPSTTGFFIENKGQWPSDVRYLTRFDGLDAWITDRGIVYDFHRFLLDSSAGTSSHTPLSDLSNSTSSADPDQNEPTRRKGQVIQMEFAGANGRAFPVSEAKRRGYHNYLIGNDPAKWVTHAPLYSVVQLRELYPGVDAVMRFDGGSLRYDLHVAPGADPRRIRMKFSGAGEIAVNGNGELVLATELGDVTHGSILAYQEIDGKERRVECRFQEEANGEVIFGLGSYNPKYPLIIDPLVYATFVSFDDYGQGGALAVDNDGNAYVTGRATSGTYPTTPGAYDEIFGGGGGTNGDIVVTKLNDSGTDVEYSTFVGGDYSETGWSIALDEERNAYVLGVTQAGSGMNTFPVTPGAYDMTPPRSGFGGNNEFVVFKLSPDGSQLRYSTYLGGRSSESTGAIAVDRNGNAHVIGHTTSTDYPTTEGAVQPSVNQIDFFFSEVVVTKLNAEGTGLLYSTYLGGESTDRGHDIAIDDEGFAYVTGETRSIDFPTTAGAYDRTFDRKPVGTSLDDVFVAKIDTTGRRLIYSTFIGSLESDRGSGIVVDAGKNAYVTGTTSSPGFPNSGEQAYDSRLSGLTDGFILKLNPAGNGLVYSTFIGGDGDESFSKITLNEGVNAVAVGTTRSENYKVTAGAHDDDYSNDGFADVVMAALNPAGSALLYSTFLGGSGQDTVSDVAADPFGMIYVGGNTLAADFPKTPGAYDTLSPTTQSSRPKIFVAQFRLFCALTAYIGEDLTICAASSLQLSTEVTNGVAPYTYSWYPATGLDKINIPDPIATPSATTQYIITVTDDGGCVDRDTIVITVRESFKATAVADTVICSGGEAQLGVEETGTQAPFTYSWKPETGLSNPNAPDPIARPTTTETYYVTVTDARGCEAYDTVVVTVLNVLTVDAGLDATVCPGEGVLIGGNDATGGSGPYLYRWEPSTGLSRADTLHPIASPTVTTLYRLRVTDAAGCSILSDPITVTVLEPPTPTITAQGPTTFCEGDSVTLDAGTGYRSYLWSNGETTQTIRVGSAGDYSVEVTDGLDCAGSSDIVTVQVHPLPGVAISGAAGICSGARNVYAVLSEANVTYTWSLVSTFGSIVQGDGTNRITVQWGNAENAIVRLTARNTVTNCTASIDYEVEVGTELKPVIQGPAQPVILCSDESVLLDAGEGYISYQWSTGETTRTIRVDRTATVWVTVRDASGCDGRSDDYEVILKPPVSARLSQGGDIRLCPGAVQTLDAPSGFAEYLWSTGETTPSIDVSAEGIYWVEVLDEDGCTGISDTAHILPAEDPPIIAPSGDFTFCDGDSITIGAASGYVAYEWSTGERTQSIVVKTAGDYWVKVTGVGGCESTSATTRIILLPLPAKPVISRAGDTLISSIAPGYQWSRDGADIPGATARHYIIDLSGTYSVRVTNPEGCSAESDGLVGMKNRVVLFDDAGGAVGERLWLTMYIDPPLAAADGVTDFAAWLKLEPAALYPHSATTAGPVAGDKLSLDYDMANGTILVKPVAIGSTVTGGALFRLELEGLVTGQPVNEVTIDSVVLEGIGSIPVRTDGIVTLTGCEIDRRFNKRARIISVVPNPGVEEVVVIYRTPEGMVMNLRVLDALGRVMKARELEAGTGEDEAMRVELEGLPGGLYILELRDKEEVVTAPLLIKR